MANGVSLWNPNGPFQTLRRYVGWVFFGTIAIVAVLLVATWVGLLEGTIAGLAFFLAVAGLPSVATAWWVMWAIDVGLAWVG